MIRCVLANGMLLAVPIVDVNHLCATRQVKPKPTLCIPQCSTVALQLDLSGNPTFSQALQRAKDMAAQAFAHSTTPFAKVVDALGVSRSAAFTPVYQAMLVFNSADEPGEGQMAPWEGLQVDPVIADRGQLVQTDLVMSVNMR